MYLEHHPYSAYMTYLLVWFNFNLEQWEESIEGFEKLYFFSPKEGPPTGRAISVGIKGDDFAVLNEIAAKIVAHLSTVEGVSDVGTNYEFGKKELRIIVDEAKAKKFFISVDNIATTVRHAFKGGIATTVKPERAEDEIDVVVRFPESSRNSLDDFLL